MVVGWADGVGLGKGGGKNNHKYTVYSSYESGQEASHIILRPIT